MYFYFRMNLLKHLHVQGLCLQVTNLFSFVTDFYLFNSQWWYISRIWPQWRQLSSLVVDTI